MEELTPKTLIYVNGWAFESPETAKQLDNKKWKELNIRIFTNKMNKETGRQDKYICNATIYSSSIQCIIDLEWIKLEIDQPKKEKSIKKPKKSK